MEDAHHTHREAPFGWMAALVEALVWSRRAAEPQDCESAGRTAPSALADGLHRLSSPH